MTGKSKRDRLIQSAAMLFHSNGIAETSLADIAGRADIPIGNVYYYFKTKEELALAAVMQLREQFLAAYKLLDEQFETPRVRLVEAVKYYDHVREDYTKYGCPVGKIIASSDIHKDNTAKAAAQIFEDFIGWAEKQFAQLGHTLDARRHAISLMAGIQGASIMAKSAGDANVMSQELARLMQWLESLPNKKIQLGKVAAPTLAE